MREQSVRDVVVDVLEGIMGKPFPIFGAKRKPVRETDSLTGDLKIDSDDFSFLFVPEVEKRLGVRVPTDAWMEVHTVRDAIDLLEEHRSAQRAVD